MVQYLQSHNTYQNCRVCGPDGELMFLGSTKKANWYLKRNLATITSTEPLTIQLTFSPKGKGHVGNSYYLSAKENKCVVCGSTDKLTKHHIVPLCYRRWFPDIAKSRTSYDVMLVCYPCHEKYEKSATVLKSQLADQNKTPFSRPQKESADAQRIYRLSLALLENEGKIPENRVEQIKNEIQVLSNQTITPEFLQQIVNTKISKPDLEVEESHFGKLLVEKLTNLDDFIKMWRKHFVDTMSPQHLPEHWQVDKDFNGY